MEDLGTMNPRRLRGREKTRGSVLANIRRGIRRNKEKKEALADLDTQERDLLEKLAIVRRKQAENNGSRKRKHSSDNEMRI